MSFSVGAVTTKLTGDISDFVDKFKKSQKSLEDLGEKGKKLQNTFDSLTRRKELMLKKLEELREAGKQNTLQYERQNNSLKDLTARISMHNDKIDDYRSKMSYASQMTKNFHDSIGIVTSSMGTIKGTFNATLGVLDRVGGAFNSIGNIAQIAIGNLIASAVEKGLGAIRNLMNGVLGVASQQQKTEVTFEVISPKFGIDPAEAKKQADVLSRQLNVSYGSIAESMQNLFKSNLTLDQSVDLIKRFNNEAKTGKADTISQAQAIENLSFAYMTGMSSLGNLSGISENFGDIEKKGLKVLQEKGELLGLTIGQLDESQKMQARYAGMIDLTNLTLGSAEKLEGSYIDLQAQKETAYNRLQASIGKLLLPTMAKLEKLQANAFNYLSNWFNQNSGMITGKLIEFEKYIGLAFGYLSNWFNENSGMITAKLTEFKDRAFEFFSYIANWVIENRGKIQETFMNAVKAVGEFITGLSNLVQWYLSNKPIIDTFLILIGSFIVSFYLVTGAIALATGAMTLFGIVMGIITSPITIVIAIIGLLIFTGVMLWQNWETVKVKAQEAWNYVANNIAGVAARVIVFFLTMLTGGQLLWMGFNLIKDKTAVTWNQIGETINKTISNIINAFSVVNWAKVGSDMIDGMVAGVKNSASKLTNAMANVAKDSYNSVTSFLQIKSPSKKFKEVGKNVILGNVDGIEQNKEKLVNSLTGAYQGATSQVTKENITNNKNKTININNYGNGSYSPFTDFSLGF